ncbi:MAG: GAF domain-containing protein [Coriobacteriia bacterium]|nr:GAF domain-containing protein [Coriobacteriia bacterium]
MNPRLDTKSPPADLGGEILLRRMLDTAPCLIGIFDFSKQAYTYVNHEVSEFLGLAPDELRDLGPDAFARFVHPDDLGGLVAHYAALQALPAGDDRTLELVFRARAADGEWRWLHSRDVPFARDESGVVTMILDTTQDMTEFRAAQAAAMQARDAVRELSDRQEAILETMPEIICELGPGQVCTWLNSAGLEFFGEDLVGSRFPEYAASHASDCSEVDAVFVGTSKDASAECWHINTTGETRLLSWHFRALDAEANGLHVLAVASDVTESSRHAALAEARLRLNEYASTHEMKDLLQEILEEACRFSSSEIAFLHFVDHDQQSLSLQTWSRGTLKGACAAPTASSHYPVTEAGVWAQALHEGAPVIHNDYASVPAKHGLPEGHAPVIRELVVPVFRDGLVVALLGVGNKPTDYMPYDVEMIDFFADTAWNLAERKIAETDRLERENRLQTLLDHAPYGAHIYELESDDRLVFMGFNDRAEQMLGIDHSALVGSTLEQAFPGNVGTETPEAYRRVAREGGTWEAEQLAYDGDKIAGSFEVYAFSVGRNRVAVFFRDITEKRRLEMALRVSEERTRALIEQASDGIFVADESGRYLEVNDRGCELLGLSRAELMHSNVSDAVISGELSTSLPDFEHLEIGATLVEEVAITRGDDRSTLFVEVSAKRLPDGRLLGIMRDITERTSAERRLRRATRALRALSACNETLVRADDEQRLLEDVCAIAVEQGGFRMTWVGYAGYDENRSVIPMASAGHVDGYLDEAQFSWAADITHNGPPGNAIRTGKPFVVRYMDSDPMFAPWRDLAATRGYASVAALPLIYSSGECFGAIMFVAGDASSFDDDEMELLAELANDLSFGVDTLRGRTVRAQMEANLLRSNEQLEGILFSLTEAMGRIVEARDPYTQGHEERVAIIAKAIAAEMGLPDEDLEAVAVSAMVHDVGKLAVPAEILTKPGRLTDIEFALIKEHPQTGYQILKDISFPWPVADIVLQHHERIDGSGYPNGLAGDDILTAARIIAVADVIEAMASHRPYRPALGIAEAVAEISSAVNKYDPAVVHACLELFASGELAAMVESET